MNWRRWRSLLLLLILAVAFKGSALPADEETGAHALAARPGAGGAGQPAVENAEVPRRRHTRRSPSNEGPAGGRRRNHARIRLQDRREVARDMPDNKDLEKIIADAAAGAVKDVLATLASQKAGDTQGPRQEDALQPGSPEAGHAHGPVDPRCEGTLGTWCDQYVQQEPEPTHGKAPPVGRKDCPGGCNGLAGQCNYAFGYCMCSQGWTGPDCRTRQKRPCTNRHRDHGAEPMGDPGSLTAPGFTYSRCAGICDEDTATCYCNGTYGRIPAPPDAPPGSPPVRRGRPMPFTCQPKLDKDDNGAPHWGNTAPELLYGADGWCEAENPVHKCTCLTDGLGGPNCELIMEQTCLNQCNGHGECDLGLCRCHEGWFGHDCAQRRENHAINANLADTRPWLAPHVHTPAAYDPPPPMRRRPLIYVYDLPPIFNTRLVQYRVDRNYCFHRAFDDSNGTFWTIFTYYVETAFHEMLLQSKHRTLDPDEADFFYVPVYSSCLHHPILYWADWPWFHGPAGPRSMHSSNLLLEAKRWVDAHLPFWRRKGGRDHIWLISHDEGPCYAPAEIRSSIILSHWGRTEANHTSNTAYLPDNYDDDRIDAWHPNGWTHQLRKPDGSRFPCYDPAKDIIIPVFKIPPAIGPSPILGHPAHVRNMLLFFRGDMGEARLPHYSRGLRQRLIKAARVGDWKARHNILVGNRDDTPGDYGTLLSQAKFCPVLPGDGFSPRAEDAIIHGCVPVVIMDGVEPPLSTALDWSQFSLRVAEADLERLPEILLAVPQARLHAMQRALGRIWQRFLYSSLGIYEREARDALGRHLALPRPPHPDSLPEPAKELRTEDDAFHTIMGILHDKMQDL